MMRFLVCFLTTFVLMNPQSVFADEPTLKWAIAIHGGAGGSPDRWDERKRDVRKAGLEKALAAGKEVLANGGAAMDAVEAAIRVLEDDASFNAGRGAVSTEDGTVELDASIMDGSTLACGAVAGVTCTKNPIGLARLVMTKTKHVLLAGPGADEFAKEQGVPLVKPDYFQSSFDNSYQRGDSSKAKTGGNEPHFGTVGCVAFDQSGDLAAGTSTGGTAKKLPGRVGDSPIVGAGTYAANDSCAVSGTGIGEEYIRHSVAYDIAAQMRYAGRSPDSAVTTVMKQRLQPGVGGLIVVSNDGEIVMQHNTPGMNCGAADSSGRFETFLSIPESAVKVASAADPHSDENQIAAIIHQQASDWSRGDIDAFMTPYWKSDRLTFSSGGKITRGWDATSASYKLRYPDKATMGITTFSELEFLRLGKSSMQVIGTWKLDRESNPIGGKFTLILRRFDNGWKIVHDHTSLLKE